MKKLKKYTCILLALLLMGTGIAGCSGGVKGDMKGTEGDSGKGQEQNGMKGRFVESYLSLPEEVDQIHGMGKLADGSIRVLAENKEEGNAWFFSSKDGGSTWESKELSGSVETKDSWVTGAAVAPDGSAVAVGYFPELGEDFAAKKISSDGQVAQFELDLSEYVDASKPFGADIAFDTAGALFIQPSGKDVLTVNMETGEVKKACDYSDSKVRYFAVAGEKLLLVTDQGIPVYHTVDGARLEQDPILDELVKKEKAAERNTDSFPVVFNMGMDRGSILYVNSNGIFYHKDEGDINEQLVNGELVSLGAQEISYRSVLMVDEEHILLQAADNNKLLEYRYDKDMATVPGNELTVYALRDSPMIRQAASLFQKQYPDVYVKVEIGMTGEDGISSEDALQALSTDIMAGNGPDVLLLDGLPVNSYIEKGILADISDVVKEIEEKDGLFEKIKAPYEKDGAIYEISTRFYFMVFDGPGAAASDGGTLLSLVEYAEKLKKENPDSKALDRNAKSLLYNLYYADSANWLNEDGSLDESALEAWLTLAKRLYDIDRSEESRDEWFEFEGTLLGTGANDARSVAMNQNLLAFGTIVKTEDMLGLLSAEKRMQPAGSYGLLNGDETKSFIPYLTAGVNSNSRSMDHAKAFLGLLLGKEYCSLGGEGFPVNRAAFEARNEETKSLADDGMVSIGSMEDDGTVYTETYEGLMTDEALDKLTGILESLDTPALTDSTIHNLVLEQGEKFLKDEQSLETTMNTLKQKMNLYLSE